MANSTFLFITRHLSAILIQESVFIREFNKEVAVGELHLEFLNQLFKTFAFPQSVLTQLDTLLTSIVNKLKSLQLKWETTSEDVGFFTSFYYFEPVVGLPIKIPKLRLFYIHINNSSWIATIGKSSAQKIHFDMTYNDFIFSINENVMKEFKETISDQINKLAGDQLAEIEKLISSKTVST
ncbi:hypothetical protein RclHR1_24730001 [Rhizophagus clarus]|nr:hypothetical protein RclHR1_24730001 [Rhizophagus clarus]